MSDREDLFFDPDSWSLVSLVEHSARKINEMSFGIEAESEDALAAEARRSDAACCEFSGRVSSASLDCLKALLDMALSEEFCKYNFNLWSR